ncbi:aminopeptidase N [Rhodocyclus tenuis]|uniref:aminopeptidase N n=1 Tax=Rhodocyclus gracilis TaxID=2929842 RepID=UPI001298A4D0|nr:aminopeptidase N [Rhodocyclus gracilis]MRD72439.1 aminopeptidase N [Rhodocyclus gracilis]
MTTPTTTTATAPAGAASPQTPPASAPLIRLCDYAPPAFLVDRVDLEIDFAEQGAIVSATLALRRNPQSSDTSAPLLLDGAELETLSLALDGVELPPARHRLTADSLTITDLPDACTLTTRVRIQPDSNTHLSGLYRSADGYFTQCEAQGFRRITWFPDRPDVMARFTVTLHAERERLPVLLANGNPVGSGDEAPAMPGGAARHWARWQDPFPKPSYLFAVVAARLDVLRDEFLTASGRRVQLAIYVEPGKLDQCGHAMAALKQAMRWDEERFGLECDLDHYMIVAVGDFNMGAMENKGLNIFNTKYVLARPDLATDHDYEGIDRVVAHEYFHNWTGNRVTCRDWFQLSLKEGLTVFRDQEFGADVHQPSVARIREVRTLRAAQFPEDAGPMRHPVRPSAYVEINNFYTATVYEKGAEVVRMIHTLLGEDAFRAGMDLYFARHDGQAVTCEDFVSAMADASNVDLAQFMRWYERAGTPRLVARGQHDPVTQRYTLTLTQLPPAPVAGEAESSTDAATDAPTPLHIPVTLGLLGADGADLPLRLAGEDAGASAPTTRTLSLTASTQEFVFEGIAAAPVPSLLRNFSAPVRLDLPASDDELALRMAHDSDAFNRWEAGQQLASRLILGAAARLSALPANADESVAAREVAANEWPESFANAAARILDAVIDGTSADPAFAAEALALPSEATLAEEMAVVDPDALFAARIGLRRFLGTRLSERLHTLYESLAPSGAYRPTSADAGRRALRHLCLDLIAAADAEAGCALAARQFATADNMSDQYAALVLLAHHGGAAAEQALADFHARWRHEALALDKWLLAQATSRRPDTLAVVRRLLAHADFDLRNPNKVYALLRGFGANHVRFHAADGAGYRFLAEQTLALDAINPQVAARLARCFDRWRRFDAGRQAQARAALERLAAHAGLSRDVAEIVSRALG